eukprot:4420895-Prymnesium_polylepis.2
MEPVAELTSAHSGWVMSVGFSPDGTRIVSGSDDGRIYIWNWMATLPPRLTLNNTIIERASAHGSEAV